MNLYNNYGGNLSPRGNNFLTSFIKSSLLLPLLSAGYNYLDGFNTIISPGIKSSELFFFN